MTKLPNAGGHSAADANQSPLVPYSLAALMDAEDVGVFCKCSARHVNRMADAGRMPAPIRLGSLVRWSRTEIEAWIAAGCPSVRTPSSRGGHR